MNSNDNFRLINFSDLHKWNESDHFQSFSALKISAQKYFPTANNKESNTVFGKKSDEWSHVLKESLAYEGNPKEFFEEYFDPWQSNENGHLTGYFEYEASGQHKPKNNYSAPLLSKPKDLVRLHEQDIPVVARKYGRYINESAYPYYSRRQIEQGVLREHNLELIWVDHFIDAYFIHIQGSARIKLPSGSVKRYSYAAKNGAPYTSIGKILVSQGEISANNVSMKTIKEWMFDRPDLARTLILKNESYIFFKENTISNASQGPIGANYVPLTPMHSLAVDRAYWPFGLPFYLYNKAEYHSKSVLNGLSTLVIAQDTGSAIRGRSRFDLFCGSGTEAGNLAGELNNNIEYSVLLPKGFVP